MPKITKSDSVLPQFSLTEYVLIAVCVIVLGLVVFVALSPVTRFQNTRDIRRYSDVNSIVTALTEYAADNGGQLPPELLSAGQDVVELGPVGCETSCEEAVGCVDVSLPLASYLKHIPVDPQVTSSTVSAYSVRVGKDNQLVVTACAAENRSIEVTK